MNITYTAQRSLVAGHVIGTPYAIAIGTTNTSRSRDVQKATQRSLSGITETLYFRGERRWRVSFAPVRGTELAALLEFLDSTESGEAFTMTLSGDALAAITVKRADSGYTLNEVMAVSSAPLTTDYFSADIEVVEV